MDDGCKLMTPLRKNSILRRLCSVFILTTVTLLNVLPANATNLEEIYNLAVVNDPQLGVAQAIFLSRNEVVAQSRANLLPNVSVGGQSSDNRRLFLVGDLPTDRYNDHVWQAVLRQPIFRLDS